MSLRTIRKNVVLAGASACLLLLLSASAAHRAPQVGSSTASTNGIALSADPAQSSVHYTVSSSLHTIHGTFALKRGNLQLDPENGRAAGEIVVDAASGKSGNDSRDKKMQKEVLESARFTDIVFRPERVEGSLTRQGSSGVTLHGVFVLHGGEHEISVPVQAELPQTIGAGMPSSAFLITTGGSRIRATSS